ncbi:MAG TPA: flippase activity-associated protein Agl23 [Pyrinomonadaceae bacterium]
MGASAAPDVPESFWRGASLAVMLVAAFVRFYALEMNPLHHDEGVNGWFLTRLVREGVYNYDPANYHGPTLYYFTLVPAFLMEKLGTGMTTFMLRAVTGLFGLAIVWLVLKLRRHLGTIGALASAALIAVSPGAVYQSRYFIHETLFVFFTLAIVVAVVRYYERGRTLDIMLAFASAALLFATKETAFISVGVLALAYGVAEGWTRLAGRMGWSADGERNMETRRGIGMREWVGREFEEGGLARFGGATQLGLLVLGGLALFVLINVLFYSSFFTYSKGVAASLETFKIWAKTGSEAHAKPFDTYLAWLQQEEAPIYVLALLGSVWALLRGGSRFHIFACAWAFGLLAAYSIVSYKTPWLSLNFVVPMAMAGGLAVQWAYERGGRSQVGRRLVLACVASGLAVSSYQMVVLNFYRYDDDKYPYVYAHTRREFLQLTGEVERLARRTGAGAKTPVAVASPDYWPLPWYLRDYKSVGFLGTVQKYTEPIVIGNESQQAQLQTLLADTHAQVGALYPLRPGVNLVLFARRDLLSPRK